MSEVSRRWSLQRWLALGLIAALIMSSSVGFYIRAVHAHAPRWVDLQIPLNTALLALLWLIPEVTTARRNWRIGLAGCFLVLSAVELFFYFYSKG